MRISKTTRKPTSHYLNQGNALTAQLSDHNLLIQGRSVFFNMMMQGRWNEVKHRYNNGFARVESDRDYQLRIERSVRLLAETVNLNPHIMFIGLAEAPITEEDINSFISEAHKHPSLEGFVGGMSPQSFTRMGIATFVNTQYFTAKPRAHGLERVAPSVTDRIQQYEVTSRDGLEHFMLVNLHFPYDIAKSKDPSRLLHIANSLLVPDNQLPVIVMGDFNVNPERIASQINGVSCYIQTDNNQLIRANKQGHVINTEKDTVDAIFQSIQLKDMNRVYKDERTSVSVDFTRQCRLFHCYQPHVLLNGGTPNHQENQLTIRSHL